MADMEKVYDDLIINNLYFGMFFTLTIKFPSSYKRTEIFVVSLPVQIFRSSFLRSPLISGFLTCAEGKVLDTRGVCKDAYHTNAQGSR